MSEQELHESCTGRNAGSHMPCWDKSMRCPHELLYTMQALLRGQTLHGGMLCRCLQGPSAERLQWSIPLSYHLRNIREACMHLPLKQGVELVQSGCAGRCCAGALGHAEGAHRSHRTVHCAGPRSPAQRACCLQPGEAMLLIPKLKACAFTY